MTPSEARSDAEKELDRQIERWLRYQDAERPIATSIRQASLAKAMQIAQAIGLFNDQTPPQAA